MANKRETTRYRSNISIEWDDILYYMGVRVQLDEIGRRRTGQALLKAIQAQGFDVLIRPWPDKVNPGANTGSSSFEDALASTPKGRQLLNCGRGNSGEPISQNGQPVLGTGGGSSPIIQFSPEASQQIRGPGKEPDEVLFHELAHAYRRTRGVLLCERMGPPYDNPKEKWDNIEEFFAILIANIYRSESRRQGLRGDHALDDCPGQQRPGHTVCSKPMVPRLTDPKAFYEYYKPKMEQIFTQPQMRGLGVEIAIYVDCDFNPLYEYGKWHWGLGEKVRAG